MHKAWYKAIKRMKVVPTIESEVQELLSRECVDHNNCICNEIIHYLQSGKVSAFWCASCRNALEHRLLVLSGQDVECNDGVELVICK